MTPAELDQLPNSAYSLLFDVRRSVRYHDKRASFFERCHRTTNMLAILLAGSVLFDIARPGNTPWWMQALALFGALLSATDLVTGFAKTGNLHRDLLRRFAELERRMIAGPAEGDCWTQYSAERLLIEMDEPTVYIALDTICRNELLTASGFKKGSEHYVAVSKWQHFTCQLWPWSGASSHA